jgi:thiol-disulfide isomerase/thioredoxin
MNLPLDAPCFVKGGEKLSLRQAIGANAAIMLEFWAIWCSPREKSLASLHEMSASNRFKGLGFAAVNVDFATMDKADAFLSEFAPELPAYHEEVGGLITRLMPVKFVPSVAVISASDGEVLYFGQLVSSTLRTVLNQFQNYESAKKPASEWSGPDRRAS